MDEIVSSDNTGGQDPADANASSEPLSVPSPSSAGIPVPEPGSQLTEAAPGTSDPEPDTAPHTAPAAAPIDAALPAVSTAEVPPAAAAAVDAGFTVRIKEYEGPLDYLLDLIRRSEKNIYEISLTEIIEQFLAYVRTLSMLDLELTSDFLVMAAEMHYIKSKMLLPYDYGKDFKDKEDPKQKLVEQLLEYQRFKLSAEVLDQLQNAEDAIIERRDRQKVLPLEPESGDDPKDVWQEVGLYELVTAFARMFLFVDKNDLAAMDVSDFNLPDAIELIRIKSRETERFPFAELITERMTRRHLIIFFLAILELVRDRQIAVRQEKQFKEIFIFSVPVAAEST